MSYFDGFDEDEEFYDDFREYDEFEDINGISALRKATDDNPRIYPCPTCHKENLLTLKDVNLGYQCDFCALKAEGYSCYEY